MNGTKTNTICTHRHLRSGAQCGTTQCCPILPTITWNRKCNSDELRTTHASLFHTFRSNSLCKRATGNQPKNSKYAYRGRGHSSRLTVMIAQCAKFVQSLATPALNLSHTWNLILTQKRYPTRSRFQTRTAICKTANCRKLTCKWWRHLLCLRSRCKISSRPS